MITPLLLAGLCIALPIPPDTIPAAPVDPGSVIVTAERDTTVALRDSTALVAPAPIDGTEYRPAPVDFITNLPRDWVDWARENITETNLPIIAGIGVATVALVLVDDDAYQAFHRPYERSVDYHRASDMAVFIGDGKFQFGIACLFGAYGFITDDARAIRTASQTTEVILACGGVVQLVKHLTGRERPAAATAATGRWALFPDPTVYQRHVPRYDAFPSGHLSTAIATLTVIMENYPEATWLPWIGCPAVAALAVGLVSSGMHWWSDFPVAAALGYTFGTLVGSRRSDDRGITEDLSRRRRPTLRIGPSILSDGLPAIGMALSW